MALENIAVNNLFRKIPYMGWYSGLTQRKLTYRKNPKGVLVPEVNYGDFINQGAYNAIIRTSQDIDTKNYSVDWEESPIVLDNVVGYGRDNKREIIGRLFDFTRELKSMYSPDYPHHELIWKVFTNPATMEAADIQGDLRHIDDCKVVYTSDFTALPDATYLVVPAYVNEEGSEINNFGLHIQTDPQPSKKDGKDEDQVFESSHWFAVKVPVYTTIRFL